MALLGINPSRPRESKPSVLEQVALGMDIASKVLGLGLAVPKYIEERKTAAMDRRLKESQITKFEDDNTALTKLETMELKKKFDIPDVMMPRTRGEARTGNFTLTAKERADVSARERDLDLKERDLKLKEQEIKQKEKDAQDKKTEKRKLTAADVTRVNEGNAIPGTLKSVAKTLSAKRALFGPVKGWIGSKNKYDAESQGVEAEMRTASQQFGKYMEGGVLRKEDEAKYRLMFPNINDLPAVAEKKLNIVSDLLNRKQQSDLSALDAQGFDIGGLTVPPQLKFVNGLLYERNPTGGWDLVE